MSIKSWLYTLLKFSNDANAIKKNKVGRRVGRRAAGRIAGKGFGRLFK